MRTLRNFSQQISYIIIVVLIMWLPGSSAVKNLPANVEDVGLILGLGISPGEGNNKPTPVVLH